MPVQEAESPTNPWMLPAWLSLGVVLYITLLPFRFEDLSLGEAWEIYRGMEVPELRPKARQQWVANVLMFVPLGFFWMAWLSASVRGAAGRMAVGLFVALFALAVTAGVEFVQAWIPRRVPSPIDISGNFTGGVIGVLAWWVVAPRLPRWLEALRRGGLERALAFYAIFYLIAALLPFDLLLSASELRAKWASDHLGLWMAGAGCDGGLRCAALRALEIAATVPVGIWLAWRLRGVSRPYLAGLGAGAGLGLGLEMAQAMTVPGIAEGAAALSRALGVWLGFACYLQRERLLRLRALARHGRALVLWGCVPYLILLFALNLGFRGLHLDFERAGQAFSELRLLPFYYHYLVSEAVAISSVMLHFAMYAPVGFMLWLWGFAPPPTRRFGPGHAAACAAALALAIETGKLFVDGLRPDYTSVLIAAAAAAAVFALMSWLRERWTVVEPAAAPNSVSFAAAASDPRQGASAAMYDAAPIAAGGIAAGMAAAPAGAASVAAGSAPVPMRALGALLGAATLVAASTWPVASLWLTLGIVAYGALLWRRPDAWLLVIPALVPVLNLSVHSGRFFFDELDLFVLATLAVAYWRWRAGRGLAPLPRAAAWALALFACSMLLSASFALLPWRAPNVNDWVQYTSQYNALRVAKGFVWALLLFALLRQSDLPVERLLRRWFVPGMTAGLALGVLAILYERLVYPGLFNFDSRYRISGTFADMHVGGPSIETWLVMTAPFALLWAWQHRSARWLLPALALFAIALYALAVTYSRGGYLGMTAALLVAAAGLLAATRNGGPVRRWRLGALLLLPLLAAGAVAVQLAGGFVDQRMAQVQEDVERRLSHWSLALDLSSRGGGMNVLGNGLGGFPRAYLAGNPEGHTPGNFGIARSADGAHLRIGPGDSLFINQRVDPPRVAGYRVEMWVRTAVPATVSLFVCEKHLRYSFGCRAGRLRAPAIGEGEGWSKLEWAFGLDGLGDARPALLQRGLTLALTYHGADGLLEVDRVRLLDADGKEYLRNGSFEQGMRHWYMTTDHLWPWRTENQWLEVWFDQGWLGAAAFLALTLAALLRLGRGGLRGDPSDAFLFASIAGALIVGVFGTIFWSPRLMMLFFLILLLGLARDVAGRDSAS